MVALDHSNNTEVRMAVVLDAYMQWAKRPDDERFLSLDDLYESTRARAERSEQYDSPSSELRFTGALGEDGTSVMIAQLNDSSPVMIPSHWSFSQLASHAKAHGDTIRRTHPEIGARLLSHNMRHVAPKDKYGFYVEDVEGEERSLRAMTGTTYGRIYDYDVVQKVQEVAGNWTVPGIYGKPLEEVSLRDTTLYASDRDVFIFLVDENTPISIPKPSGGTEDLFRGFMVSNSEVGASSFKLSMFLYRTVCCNRMVMGAQDIREISLRHTSGAPERFVQEGSKILTRYAESTLDETRDILQNSMTKRVGANDDTASEWLRNHGVTKSQATSIVARANEEEGQARTVWDVVQGGTALARGIKHQDARVQLERKVSKLLKVAA